MMLCLSFLYFFLLNLFDNVFNCCKYCLFTLQLYEKCFSNKVLFNFVRQKWSWFVAHDTTIYDCNRSKIYFKLLPFFLKVSISDQWFAGKYQNEVVRLLSEEVSCGAMTGNCVRDCVGRTLFQTNILVSKGRFCIYEL